MISLAEYWESQRVITDFFTSSAADDAMTFAGHRSQDLLKTFGSPVYVYSPATAVKNFDRLSMAFRDHWSQPIIVYYALKANPNLALCSAVARRGAGADCMSTGDLFGASLSGFASDKIVLNGSSKDTGALTTAAKVGATINIDSQEDIRWLQALDQNRAEKIPVRIRLRIPPGSLEGVTSDHLSISGDLDEYLQGRKWGFSTTAVIEIIARLRTLKGVDLRGFHFHYGRLTRSLDYFQLWAAALAKVLTDVERLTGYVPDELDIGGGWPRERDPESGTEGVYSEGIEVFAEAVCGSLRDGLAGFDRLPDLQVEPGSYIAANTCVLLSTLLGVKTDVDTSWAHIDASTTNHMARLDAVQECHVVAPTSGLTREMSTVFDVVGPTCFASNFRRSILLPPLVPGEPIAVLDAGMYAEVLANHFNGLPVPASVSVDGEVVQLLKARETGEEWFARQVSPASGQAAHDASSNKAVTSAVLETASASGSARLVPR